MNPLLQGTNTPIKQFMQTIQMARNPQMALQQIAQNNPQMRDAIEKANKYVQENGGDPKTVFLKTANEMGVDPNSIINQLM